MAVSTDAARAMDMSGRIKGGKVTYEKLPSFDSNGLSRSVSDGSNAVKTPTSPFDLIPVS